MFDKVKITQTATAAEAATTRDGANTRKSLNTLRMCVWVCVWAHIKWDKRAKNRQRKEKTNRLIKLFAGIKMTK